MATQSWVCGLLVALGVLLAGRESTAVVRVVATTSQLTAALAAAGAGDEIHLQPGVYGGGHYRANLSQVTIRSSNRANPAIIDGGSNGIQLSDASSVTIADLVFRNQTGNGLNIDDGGSFATPTTNITLRNITVRDIVTAGNNDGIKLSGVNGFLIEGVRVLNWGIGGSAVDMVGCHDGLVQNSLFAHTNTSNGGTTLQPKGGSKNITFRANRIELPPDAGRAVQAGGSTGAQFFRFVDGDSGYEADEIVAEGNVIIGGSSAFSWVNIDGGIFHHNVVHRPYRWVARILNENQGSATIVDTQNGQLHDNRIVFNDTGSEFSTAVNDGPETEPDTYSFARNRWLNLANPTPGGSRPALPTVEVDGVYGGDAMAPTDAAHVWDFHWGKWIVNANASVETVEVADYQSFRRALAGGEAEFEPLENDPLRGAWTSQAISAATIELPAFSQVILINPANCSNCFGVLGDYDNDGFVNLDDYDAWQSAFGTSNSAADGSGNGVVDAADYVVWRKAMGGAFAAAVPEPSSSMLGWFACALAALNRILSR